MPQKRYHSEEIVDSSSWKPAKVCRSSTTVTKFGSTEQTYYRWKKEYSGLRVDQAKRLKSVEQDSARLKRLVADRSLDNRILQEMASGNF